VLGSITIPGIAAPHRCLGVAQPYAEVAVLRPDGTPAEAGEVGLLGVKGATVTPGYWNDSERTYRSLLNGYWLSGDLVSRDDAGRFYHVDRAVDAIRTAGGPVYSILTEEILLAHLPEISDCVVVAAGEDRAIALVHLRDGHAADGMLARANEILAGLGSPPLADLRAADPDSVPVGVTGKVLKRRLRQTYAGAER
jgi:acyl-coenzyme A synthetase/AMP-(fatty) acid ligase